MRQGVHGLFGRSVYNWLCVVQQRNTQKRCFVVCDRLLLGRAFSKQSPPVCEDARATPEESERLGTKSRRNRGAQSCVSRQQHPSNLNVMIGYLTEANSDRRFQCQHRLRCSTWSQISNKPFPAPQKGHWLAHTNCGLTAPDTGADTHDSRKAPCAPSLLTPPPPPSSLF